MYSCNMSTSHVETLDVKNWLTQQHITISLEWVEACIAFLKQEYAGQSLSLQVLKNYVYQQWLTADLEEIGVSALPTDLPTTQKTTLNGYFALQVDGIRDVGRPAYAQLKELEGCLNTNSEYSSAPAAAVPVWESKPTRMLMLNLTDGCTHIQGMEYKSVTSLSPNLPAGIKVLIQGPVDCRFGILLLTAEKIKILGGEVESKLKCFSRENILREVLQLRTDDGLEAVNAIANAESSASAGQNADQFQMNNSGSSYASQMHEFDNTRNIQASTAAENNIDHFESDDDDFDRSLDYEAIDEIEKINSQREKPDTFLKTLSSKRNSVNTGILMQQTKSITTVNEPAEVWLEDEDEDVVQEMMAFQDENPGFEMPFKNFNMSRDKSAHEEKPFIYLSSVANDPNFNCSITVKAFIIRVLSKLECTADKGWSLSVKINDGTCSLDVNIHDKVLEDIIGIPAADVVKMQLGSSSDAEKAKVLQAISKCKLTLQNSNCLMDIKFAHGELPCLIKCTPVSKLHMQQLLQRVRSTF